MIKLREALDPNRHAWFTEKRMGGFPNWGTDKKSTAVIKATLSSLSQGEKYMGYASGYEAEAAYDQIETAVDDSVIKKTKSKIIHNITINDYDGEKLPGCDVEFSMFDDKYFKMKFIKMEFFNDDVYQFLGSETWFIYG